jgi:hypothetical protein
MLRIFPKSRQKKNQGHKETSYCVDLAFDPKKKKKRGEREKENSNERFSPTFSKILEMASKISILMVWNLASSLSSKVENPFPTPN